MIAISFLGLGKYDKNNDTYYYDKTEYSFLDQIIETDHFPYAFYEFVKPDKFYVIMTKAAKEAHAAKLKKLCNFEEINIPDGKTEDEFWVIFDKITKKIKENDEVIFDITHGFRSQPFIVIVLLLYLKVVKNIKIVNILYGAFDARDDKNIAPVFELKSFIELIDWTNAAKEFIENGNMKYFNSLLKNIHKNTHLSNSKTPSKQLQTAGKSLAKLTDAFDTIRLNEILSTSVLFEKGLKDLLDDMENHAKTKPFKVLLENIVIKLSNISRAESNLFTLQGIEAQKHILKWYVETNKFQKAITLAREFVITKYMLEFDQVNMDSLTKKEKRFESEKNLGSILQLLKNKNIKLTGKQKNYATIWGDIALIRNDINHAGMNENPKSSETIIKQVKIIVDLISKEF